MCEVWYSLRHMFTALFMLAAFQTCPSREGKVVIGLTAGVLEQLVENVDMA